MSKAVLSDKYPEYADKLTKLGYTAIPSERVESFIEYERDHADMQCLIIDDTAFVLCVCDKLANALKSSYNVVLCGDNISGRYPYNVALNAAVAGKYVICKADSLENALRILKVKQCNYLLFLSNKNYMKNSEEQKIIIDELILFDYESRLDYSNFFKKCISEGNIPLRYGNVGDEAELALIIPNDKLECNHVCIFS